MIYKGSMFDVPLYIQFTFAAFVLFIQLYIFSEYYIILGVFA